MPHTSPPYHQAQILRTLPAWTRTLHPSHVSSLMRAAGKDYLDENGSPHSWYAAASAEDQLLLKRLIGYRDTQVKAVHASLKGFKTIDTFCRPLLKARLGLDVEVDKAQYVHQPFETFSHWVNPPGFEISVPPVQPPGTEDPTTRPKGPPQKRSLLEAALHNFEGLEEVGPYDALTPAPDNQAPLPTLTPETFVRQCRELDLGQQYQAHLHAIYEGPNQADIARSWQQASRQALKVQALIASHKGLLTPKGRAALLQLCNNETEPRYGDLPLQCWRFSLFGIPLHEVLLLGPDSDGQSNPCVVYIPNDSQHPIREFPSLLAAGNHLRQRLVQTEFRRRLIGFAYKDRQAELSIKLEEALFENSTTGARSPRANPNIQFVKTRLAPPIWPVLFSDHKQRLKADARTVAVPTADADAKARQKRLQHWLDAGMNVLNVAAFFVPGLDAVMMCVFAYDIMDSVFTGFEAWEEGNTHEALGQLESLAINAAAVAGFAVGAKALKASGFVDALESVCKGGTEKLWHTDTADYASNVALPDHSQPDVMGLHRLHGKTYLRLDNRVHEVFEDQPGQWRMRHPSEPNAYSPRLLHNGRGAWRQVHERPLSWSDATLMRRLGPNSHGLNDDELLGALRSTGIDPDLLRQVHQLGSRPPARLIDTLQRLALDNETADIIQRIRQRRPLAAYKHYALPEILNLPGWPADHVLKVYEGPEPFGSHARLGADWAPGQVEIEVTLADLENGDLCQVIIDQLNDEALRALLGDTSSREHGPSRLAENLAEQLQGKRQTVFASLQASRRPALGIAEQALGRQFPGLPDAVLHDLVETAIPEEQQRMLTFRIPLRIAERARIEQAHSRLDRALLGLYRASMANADSLKLSTMLRAEHRAASPAQLFELAVADRTHVARLLGQRPIKPRFVPPSRLAEGRVGYPLSGRARRDALDRLHQLYPTLEHSQLKALLKTLSDRGDAGAQIKALQGEQQILDDHLRAWELAGTPEQQPSRNQLREVLNRAWRRDYKERFTLALMHIEALPSLPVRMDHITRLDIDAIGLQEIPEDFLRCFPKLQHLSIRHNPALRVPSLFRALPDALNLSTLQLTNCGLTELTSAQSETLAGLAALHTLDLHGNPLQQISGLERFTHLATLDLGNCQLSTWPQGLTQLMEQEGSGLRTLDISGNNIGELPDLQRLLASPFSAALNHRDNPTRWTFHDNPLAEDVALQLANRGVHIDFNAWLLDTSEARQALWQQLFANGALADLEEILQGLADVRDQGIEVDVWPMLEQMADIRTGAQALNAPDLPSRLMQRIERVASRFVGAEDNALADALSTLRVEVDALNHLVATPPHHGAMFNTLRRLHVRECVNEVARTIHQGREISRAQIRQVLEANPRADISSLHLPALNPLDDLAPDLVLRDDSDLEAIRLRLREELADVLDFPEPGPFQWFMTESPFSATSYYNVEQHVLGLDADVPGRRTWIAQHPIWQTYLRTHFAERFETLSERWVEVMTYLEGLQHAPATADHGLPPEVLDGVIALLSAVIPEAPVDIDGMLRPLTLNEGQYLDASNLIPARLQQEQDTLIAQLTAEADPN